MDLASIIQGKHAILNWTRECTCASNDKKRHEPEGHLGISARSNSAEAHGSPNSGTEARNLLQVDKTIPRDIAPIALQERDGGESVEWLVNVPKLFHQYFITTKDQHLAKLQCVVYKKCDGQGKQPPPISPVRGTVIDDYCVCWPKQVGRNILSTRDGTVEPGLPNSSGKSICVKRAVSAAPEDEDEVREPVSTNLHSVTDIVRCTTSCNSSNSRGYGHVSSGKCICMTKLNCAYHPCPIDQHAISNGTTNCMCIPNSNEKRQDSGACEKPSSHPVIPEVSDSPKQGTVSQNPLTVGSPTQPTVLGSHQTEKRVLGNPSACRKITCPGNSHGEYLASYGSCQCVKGRKKQQRRSDGCADFSCPSGYTRKLNGSVCYCGSSGGGGLVPDARGPATVSPSKPNEFEGGLAF